MVYKDLSDLGSVSSQQNAPIAFVVDRFLSLIFDFLIFSPLVGLAGAGLLRQVKTLFLLNPRSLEALLLWGFLLVAMAVMIVFLQSVFLYFWQATPGQLFMQMRVVSYPQGQGRLRYSQCVQRSLFWTGSFFVLGLPFLEILSHPLRRAFYDRAADTMVVTLKKQADPGPHPLEVRYFSSWSRLFSLLLLFVLTLSFFKSLHSLKHYAAQEVFKSPGVCEHSLPTSLQGRDRLDHVLALFLLNGINADCLSEEADVALWSETLGSDIQLAYLSKALSLSDPLLQQEYQKKICSEGEGRETCALAQVLLSSTGERTSPLIGGSLSAQVVLMDQNLEAGEYVAALRGLQILRGNDILGRVLEKKYIRAIWSLQENQQKGRAPANYEANELIQDFKESYDLL